MLIVETDSTQADRPGDDFAVAFDRALCQLQGQVEAACAEAQEWPARVALGLRAAFAFAAEHPQSARLLTNEALNRGEDGQAGYRRMIARFAALLHSQVDPNGDRVTIAEEAIVGGVALLVGGRLRNGRDAELAGAAREAAQFVLTPYVGIEEARLIAAKHL